MRIAISKNLTNQRILSIICFCLFSGWLLSVVFEGQIMYVLVSNTQLQKTSLINILILLHSIGLFSCGFFVKKQIAAKMTMIAASIVCISGSLIFFLPFSILWYIAFFSISLFAGFFIASWGFFYKAYTPSSERLKTAAEVLIFSNIIMIIFNVIAVTISVYLALALTIIGLIVSLLIAFRLEDSFNEQCFHKKNAEQKIVNIPSIFAPMLLLCIFIIILTVNSGIMYQLIQPAFSHLRLLTSYYWAMPYIITLWVLKNLSNKINLAYILYIALTMIGLSFMLFMLLDRSATSYLVINTLMLAAFGVCDLFWWSILGMFFDYNKNPSQVLGIGLSMNVLGIVIGGAILSNHTAALNTSVIALIIVFIVLMILPLLNHILTKVLKDHAFLVQFASLIKDTQHDLKEDIWEKYQLTEKETAVIQLLLQGYTYKAISEKLYISDNTTKFHVKNIYQKLNVSKKIDVIKIFTES